MKIVEVSRPRITIPTDPEERKALESKIRFSPAMESFEEYLYDQFDLTSIEAGSVVVAMQQALVKQAGLGKMFAKEELKYKLITFQEYLERAFPLASDQVADMSDAFRDCLLDLPQSRCDVEPGLVDGPWVDTLLTASRKRATALMRHAARRSGVQES